MSSSIPRPPEPTRCLWLTKGLGRGGVERLLVDMYPLVDRTQFDVDVAYVLPWKKDYHGELERLGASVHCLGSSHGAKDLRWVERLRRLVNERRYQAIHTHAPIPALAARLLPFRTRPAIIHTEHNVWPRYRLPTRLANSVTYGRNAAVVAVSGVVANSIQPWPLQAQEVRTIHHGTVPGSVRSYGAEERRDRRLREGLPGEEFLIGHVGNFTPKKDHQNLLTALLGDGPIGKAHLALVGLGPLEEELRAFTVEKGIEDRVTFLGSRGDVFELLPLFDLFCLSSEFEGFPIALVEAMASGLACVATSVGGIPEVIDDGRNGLLVPAQDSEALRAGIELVMNDADLRARLGRAAKETAEGLDLSTAVRELQAIYDGAAGASRQ